MACQRLSRTQFFILQAIKPNTRFERVISASLTPARHSFSRDGEVLTSAVSLAARRIRLERACFSQKRANPLETVETICRATTMDRYVSLWLSGGGWIRTNEGAMPMVLQTIPIAALAYHLESQDKRNRTSISRTAPSVLPFLFVGF